VAWIILIAVVLLVLAARRARPQGSDPIAAVAEAIARAEGYYVPGSLPQRANNPGGLRLYGETAGITQFQTPEQGWQALYSQLEWVAAGLSQYYQPSMNWWEFGAVWTGGDNAATWTRNVTAYLGLAPDSPIGQTIFVRASGFG
jgi:hypothetical protein